MYRLRQMAWKWKAAVGMLTAIVPLIAVFMFIVPVAGSPRAGDGVKRHSYTLFESGPVRPLALSPSGRTLYAANIPDNRLEVFRVTGSGLQHRGSVSVGLEPVAVAAVSDDEVWVVNHLSDSVSIVEIAGRDDDDDDGRGPVGRVVRTLLVGDEPRDIVLAGPGRSRAFITTAHRGQNVPYDPQLTTPSIGRADVWVFDVNRLGNTLAGVPLTIITLFMDTPRALAVTPDGSRVYAAGFLSGNRTTTIFEELVSEHGGLPEPRANFEGILQPPTSLIVKYDGRNWKDELGRVWDSSVKFSLPDKDVFEINALANPPVATNSFAGVGTTIFNMVVNPKTGHVYASNTDAHNDRRFEGAGVFLQHFGKKTVRGNLADSRITVIGRGVSPRHLNKHIDREAPLMTIPNDVNRRSLAFPMDMVISADGSTLYVAAFGSSKVGVFNTQQLENDTFVPNEAHQIRVSGGGPGGLALDEKHHRLYVLTRFNNSISIVDTKKGRELRQVPMFNPEPESVVKGRPFLYDAAFTSSRGDSACASCHIFGDFDALAWDLGDPDDSEIANNGIFTVTPAMAGSSVSINFRPMKGPMTTQSLRGLDNHGAMHWRGDRLDNSKPSAQPNSGAFDENAAFLKFNAAFQGLTGRTERLPREQMQAFADFVLQITYPPNPIRKLDNSLTPDQQAGKDFFVGGISDAFLPCSGCHVLNPAGNAEFGVARPGFFGTDGRFSFEAEQQIFKIPHLRNMYQKVGKFGMPRTRFILPESFTGADNAFMGDQVRGFGFLHDGSFDTMNRFHSGVLFLQRGPGTAGPLDPGNPGGFPFTPAGFLLRRQVDEFMLAFDSNLAPVVGQQVTITAGNRAQATLRAQLFLARAARGECDVVAKRNGRGFVYLSSGFFRSDSVWGSRMTFSQLVGLAGANAGEITFTCVPPGSGVRIGIDRDEDGILDADDRKWGDKKGR
jgi:DNA-binding beta-propeller fold protein YncE